MEIVDPIDNSFYSERPVFYAGFWARFAASFIDGLIVGVALIFVNLLLLKDTTLQPLFNVIVAWLYSALQESGPGMATIGKKALNIKVTGLHGQRISFGQATGRHFGKLISAAILLIGYFMMLWDDKRQALHDKLASTLVVTI